MLVFLVVAGAFVLYILLRKMQNPLLFAILFLDIKRDKIDKKTSQKQSFAVDFHDYTSEVCKLLTSIFLTSHVCFGVFTRLEGQRNS